MTDQTLPFEQLGMNDVDRVGGKNASLGEMISNLTNLGVSVPTGYATTADAFRQFLQQSGLDERIHALLDKLDIEDVKALAEAGKQIRQWVVETPFTPELEAAIREGYTTLCGDLTDISVAVRSSATAEDLPDASFAGQQETFLNIRGIDNVLHSVKEVFASLFNDRAISYRVHQGFNHKDVALSAGIQRMCRSETGASGVMFTLDTESGHPDMVFITASYGLGEMVVQGAVNPDEFYVHKPTMEAGFRSIIRRKLGSKAEKMVYGASAEAGKSVEVVDVDNTLSNQYCITDDDVLELAKQAMVIEKHYGRPMDIEWGKDGDDGKIYILQARPETVRSQSSTTAMERYRLKETSTVLVEGRSIGEKIGAGTVRVVSGLDEMDQVQQGDVLVTDMTDPDWEPVMKRCAAIVTNRGGRTCHAAIIARELGIPAVVGCDNATSQLTTGQAVTVSCAEGDTGNIWEGLLEFDVITSDISEMPDLPIDVMMNVANPDRAMSFAMLPNKGVGLARLEFIINRQIGIHPKALLNYDDQSPELKETINAMTAGYDSPVDFYIEKIVEGVATIAGAFYPNKVIVRMSDFKSNEYANLVGGQQFEPEEENPMIGFRGASRYIADSFRDCFELECKAMKKVREKLGLTNVWLMIPFVRTVSEAQAVEKILAENGLVRGENGLKLMMMCELPSNALLANEFLEHFDGFSIGSNDMTQLTLGLDRDSGLIAHLFDERNDAVKKMLSMAIEACRAQGKYVGICGQGPSDHPDLAKWLMEQNISSVSLTPDTVQSTWMFLSENT
ncbi:phosphoenolpyruvate synthase [Marinibactrum halimedae]|uniref:Phosphoenolpyruvate synthase n=1 Tax=Marinibactrum halimedae TaxID=1444977 RepID=A0AA37WKZ4_9GAMM|nr:phosphoenolpyruvate synthase [Marinibactrum halimedae]MCD9459880.1 phosphoenolpyruvate synthase [Marinibactrum halimedae]GLS25264.1 phosphoenolpyruvate synthase [Marinibactrum halimedae]